MTARLRSDDERAELSGDWKHAAVLEICSQTDRLTYRQTDREAGRQAGRQAYWKHAAMVIDRLCLCMFTAFTLVLTTSILFSAPHLFVL